MIGSPLKLLQNDANHGIQHHNTSYQYDVCSNRIGLTCIFSCLGAKTNNFYNIKMSTFKSFIKYSISLK